MNRVSGWLDWTWLVMSGALLVNGAGAQETVAVERADARAPGNLASADASSGKTIPSPLQLLGMQDLAQVAKDLVTASGSLERFGQTLERATESLADGLARMSSGFDPFGFQMAFRTLGEQTHVIEQQQQLIFELQQREIDRLRAENERLRGTLRDQQDRVGPGPAGRRGANRRRQPTRRAE